MKVTKYAGMRCRHQSWRDMHQSRQFSSQVYHTRSWMAGMLRSYPLQTAWGRGKVCPHHPLSTTPPPYLYSLGCHFITFHIPLSSHATPTKLMAPPPLVPHPPCFKTIVSLGIPSQEPPPQTVHCIVFSEGREGGRVVWSNETAEEQGNIPNTVVSIVRLM